MGSVVALSNNSGEIVERYEYDVFGRQDRVSDVNNPYFFTGRRYDDEIGLYYYRARYYDPYIGRFLQTDPIRYTAGLNLYTYVGNNPISFVDPWGLCKEDGNDAKDPTTEEPSWLDKLLDILRNLWNPAESGTVQDFGKEYDDIYNETQKSTDEALEMFMRGDFDKDERALRGAQRRAMGRGALLGLKTGAKAVGEGLTKGAGKAAKGLDKANKIRKTHDAVSKAKKAKDAVDAYNKTKKKYRNKE